MSPSCCKVGEVIDGYELHESVVGGAIDDYLVARWRGERDYAETGLRPLADWFNRNLLRTVYAEEGRTATKTRIESEYETLTDGDGVRRGEVLDDLRADGIDGGTVVDDFVSASTIYRHFRDCLDESKESGTTGADSDWERDKVAYARETARRNAAEAIRSLDNKDRITNAGDADVEVPVFLSCPVCSTRVRFGTALNRGYVCRDHLGGPTGDDRFGSGRSGPGQSGETRWPDSDGPGSR